MRMGMGVHQGIGNLPIVTNPKENIFLSLALINCQYFSTGEGPHGPSIHAGI